jgi:hypothetical protein
MMKLSANPLRIALRHQPGLIFMLCTMIGSTGCSSIRVTDPPRSADEQFLLTEAVRRSVAQLAIDALRDRSVWIETGYAISTTQPYDRSFLTSEVRQPSFEELFVVAELRARLLRSGVRLAQARKDAQVILELRIGAVSNNREEFLLGIPATAVPADTGLNNSIAIATPEIAILKKTTQRGFASLAFVAYWADSGELVTLSGPFVGRSLRKDVWILGTGPTTTGDIPPALP